MLSRIIIGTANFTQRYGILSTGDIDSSEVVGILAKANESGIAYLDTAFGYGDILNDELSKVLKCFSINTKFSVLDDLDNIYARLKKKSESYCIDSLLVHDPQNLYKSNKKKLIDLFSRLEQGDIVKKIGVSVYDLEDVYAFDEVYKPKVIQFPLNLLNQTFNVNKFIDYVNLHKVETQARSLFLQGILLIDKLPAKLSLINKEWTHLIELLGRYSTRLHGLLHWAFQYEWIDKWVLGVSSQKDLNMVIKTSSQIDFNQAAINYKGIVHPLIDPRNW